jgi:hypothetical protein
MRMPPGKGGSPGDHGAGVGLGVADGVAIGAAAGVAALVARTGGVIEAADAGGVLKRGELEP